MSRVESAPRLSHRPTAVSPRTVRTLTPIKVCAGLGAAFLAFQLYIYTAWIVSGDARRTPAGSDPIPGWMRVVANGWQVAALLGLAFFLWVFLFRPMRRRGHVSLEGLIALAVLSVYWQDPLMNIFQNQFTYNAAFVNLGSWAEHIPGWLAPRGGRIAEPLLWTMPMYIIYMGGFTFLGSAIMRRVRQRRPHFGVGGVIAVAAMTFVVLDFTTEPVFLRMGLYIYTGVIPWATLFHGHYYQFNMLEGLASALDFWTPWACLHFFRNDKGETLVERGLSQLRCFGWRRTGLRFLAISGAFNAIMLVLYSLPLAIVGLYAGPWPDDIQQRSYMTNGICGPGTSYACSGPGRPINRPDSLHVSPDGRLIVPEGTRLPQPGE